MILRLLLALAGAAFGAEYPDNVVLGVLPRHLWASAPRAGDRITLTYKFLNAGGVEPCPRAEFAPDPARYPPCARFQEAAVDALRTWAQASGRVELRPGAAGERAHVYIGWTEIESIGLVVHNSMDPHVQSEDSKTNARGFEHVMFPDLRQHFETMVFTHRVCWHLEDASVCRPTPPKRARPVVEARGYARGEQRMDLRGVALHEAGHVFGFHHFHSGAPTVMGIGGSALLELQDVDRRAVRELYDRAVLRAKGPRSE